MSLILRHPLAQQPQQAAPVDWSNPLARGLAAVIDSRTGINLVQPGRAALIRGTRLTSSGASFVRGYGTTNGVGSSDSIASSFSSNGAGGVTGARSWFFRYALNGTGGGGLGRIFQKGTGSTGSEFLFCRDGGNFSFTRANEAGTELFDYSIPAGGYGTGPHSMLLTTRGDGSVLDLVSYLDGLQVGDNSSGGSAAPVAASNSQFYWVGNNDNLNRNVDGLLGSLFIWDRTLSAAEARELHANEWQLFAPPPRRLWVPVAAGAGSTVTAAQGASTVNFAGASNAQAAPTAAAGSSTVAFNGAAQAAASVAPAAGTSAVSFVGASTVTATVTPAAGTSTVSFESVAATGSVITPAAGSSVVSFSGASSATAVMAPAQGSSTVAFAAPSDGAILSPAASQPVARRMSAPTMWARREEEEPASGEPAAQPSIGAADPPTGAVAEQMRALAERAGQVEARARTQAERFIADMKALQRPLYAPLRTPDSLPAPTWDDEEESALLLL